MPVFFGTQDPLLHKVITSVTVENAIQATYNVGSGGSGVVIWKDLSGHGRDWYGFGGGANPSYQKNTLNGRPTVFFSSSPTNNELSTSPLISPWTIPAPGTQPFWVWGILKWGGSAVSARVRRSGIANVLLVLSPASGIKGISQFNGSQRNATAGNSGWAAFEAYFSNSASDYCRFGTSQNGGIGCGNSAPNPTDGQQIIAVGADFSVAAMIHCSGKPTNSELLNLRGLAQSIYGTGVTV